MIHEVTILTGFLGAGKTTFLNAILTDFPKTKFAIIENEFGEIGIDGELVLKPDDSIIEMNNGCLCCSLNNDLYDILNELLRRSSDFTDLLIETTGIADPAGVAEPFFTDSSIAKDFKIKRVIGLVDAQLILEQLKNTEIAIKQLVFSDILVLNKTDGVLGIEKIIQTLTEINPFAKIFIESGEIFPLKEILAIERDQDFKSNFNTQNNFLNKHHQHSHGEIESVSFTFEHPFNLEELQMRLYGFLAFHAQNIYRLKGIIYANQTEHRIIVQSVSQNLSISGGKKWEEEETKMSKLVFIGKNIDKQFIDKLLRAALLTF